MSKLSDRLRPNVECAPWVIESVVSLEKELEEAIDEINWWKKKHAEDCQEIRLVGRREGEKLMREKCQKVCIDVARSESYYSDNVGDECAEEISKIEISRSLENERRSIHQ
jgi:hypothetical protein